MRLAVLADIHGNLPALEAVLADTRQQSVDGIIVAGDMVDRPQPLETLRTLHTLGAWIIRGNRENYLLAYDTGDAPEHWRVSKQWIGLRWIYHQLDREVLDFLHTLPEQQVIAPGGAAPVRVVHGSPRSDTGLILPDGQPAAMDKYRPGLLDLSYSRLTLDEALDQVHERALVCAHSHIPWVQEQGGRLVLNPGSVGAPINGDTRAQYALLTWRASRWHAENRAIDYSLEQVREAYEASGILARGSLCQGPSALYRDGTECPRPACNTFPGTGRQIWIHRSRRRPRRALGGGRTDTRLGGGGQRSGIAMVSIF